MRLRAITAIVAGLPLLAAALEEPIPIKEGLMIGGVVRGGRAAISVDPVLGQLVRGALVMPKDGDGVQLGSGRTATWRKAEADKDGWFSGGNYLFASVQLPSPKIMLLEAQGDGMVYVNGEPRGGDPYAYGYFRVPVELRAGFNRLLFTLGRGRVKAALLPRRAVAMIDPADATLPDILTTDRGQLMGSLVVINASLQSLVGARIAATAGGRTTQTLVPPMPPMTLRKVRVDIPVPDAPKPGTVEVGVDLLRRADAKAVDSAKVSLRVVRPVDVHKRTFVSRIDGSVQYYAVNPAKKPGPSNMLVLSTHGASVEALGQAQAYASHDDWTLVAPTNRRPYGYDWEDWGRLDALEVLEIAKRTIPHDPQRVVLTGHSMGGHGAWHLGVTYPDLFAAIGPSAGWSSFFSYAGSARLAPTDAIAKLMARATSASDTLGLTRNTLMEDVYILHGGADDNVPVSEARLMRDNLAKFNPRMQYHEEPGQGHWWGKEQGPGWGTACVDWKPMFEVFEKARLPLDREVKEIDFTTANPAVSGKCHWATIEQQVHPLEFSNVALKRVGPNIVGATQNVAALSFELGPLGGIPSQIVLDGNAMDVIMFGAGGGLTAGITALRRDGKWTLSKLRRVEAKSARRSGPFKQAFMRNMAFVYSTGGKPEENAWTLAKARFDAEQWQYRGNGAVDLIADRDLDPKAKRNVILYGNSEINRAWSKVLAGCPVNVRRHTVTVGAKTVQGDELGCLFVYPKGGDPDGLVGVVAGTGPVGMRVVERLPVLSSGTAFPDWIVLGPEAFEKGLDGVRGVGYFGNDWGVQTGDFAWRVSPPR